MTKNDILDKYISSAGHQRNFVDKATLREELKKDFNLNDNQISFEGESVLINIGEDVIKLDLLIDRGELRFKRKQ